MLEDRLENLYQKVMEIEKFAEAKNSILLTFIAAILVLLYDLFGSQFYSWPNFLYGLPIFAALGAIILSFLPYKDNKKSPDKKKIPFSKGMNLFNVKDLAKLSYVDKQLFSLMNANSNPNHDDYQQHLLEGVLYNARITKRKLLLFSWSIQFLFVFPALFNGISFIINCIKRKSS